MRAGVALSDAVDALGSFVPPGKFSDPALAAKHQAVVEAYRLRMMEEEVAAFKASLPKPARPEAKPSRAEQSRINGSKSKGPVTAAGKAVASGNAFKHGLYSKSILLPGEDSAELEAFCADFAAELQPSGTCQSMMVNRAAGLAWKLRRLPVIEEAILENCRERDGKEDLAMGGMGNLLHELMGAETDGVLMRLQQYEVRLERSLSGCLRELRLLRKDVATGSGSFRQNGLGSFGDFVGWGSPHRERGEVQNRSSGAPCGASVDTAAVRGASGGLNPTLRDEASGSFRQNVVGSFRTGSQCGQREAASIDEAALAAQGPSTASQDDVCAFVLQGEVGAGAGGLGSLCSNNTASDGISGSFSKNSAAGLRMGDREEAVKIGAASPARGPSATRQDDVLAGVFIGEAGAYSDGSGSFHSNNS